MIVRWTKDEIALEILRIYVSGEPLNYCEVEKHDLRLLRAATRYFGSWKSAIEYAGLNYDLIRRYQVWSKDRIIERIRKYHEEGRDLSWRHVSTKMDPPLAAAATRECRFGGWQQALEAAGLDYEAIRRNRAWDFDSVVTELHQRRETGESLRASDVAEECPALAAAARRHFAGWYAAIEAAGIDEFEARLGIDGEYDEEMARGEMSWSESRGE